MSTREEMLACRVVAANNAYKYANTLYDFLVEKFFPLVGKKILKADGQLLAKYEVELPPPMSRVTFTAYRISSHLSLGWKVSACAFMPPNGCMYHSASVYIGDLDGTILTSISPHPTYRIDYTVGEIIALRKTYKTLQNLADNAKSALYPFGESDN